MINEANDEKKKDYKEAFNYHKKKLFFIYYLIISNSKEYFFNINKKIINIFMKKLIYILIKNLMK